MRKHRSISLWVMVILIMATLGLTHTPSPVEAGNMGSDSQRAAFLPSTTLVVNEMDINTLSTDISEFVEIKNVSTGSINLTTYTLEFYNGTGGAPYRTFALVGTLAAGDYYVVCANSLNTPNCDLDVTPETDLITNANPRAVAIRDSGILVDTVSYGGNTIAPYTEGTGSVNDNGVPNVGLSRFPDGIDTDQNNSDVTLHCITPGLPNNIAGTTGCTDLIINEIDYDQNVTDNAEFIEIKNKGTNPANLFGYNVVIVNSAGTVLQTANLPNTSLAAGDYYVICGDAAFVANCDLDILPDVDLIPDGAPGAVAIRFGAERIETVSYEGNTTNFTETAGTGLIDDGLTPNQGISRFPDGVDTDVNNVDLSPRCISPGLPNISTTGSCGAVPTDTPIPTDTPTETPITPTDTPTPSDTPTATNTPGNVGDNNILWDDLYHSATAADPETEAVPGHVFTFRNVDPSGNVYPNTAVDIYALADEGDVLLAEVRFWDGVGETVLQMDLVEKMYGVSFRSTPAHDYDLWHATIPAYPAGTIIYYRVRLYDGGALAVLKLNNGQYVNPLGQHIRSFNDDPDDYNYMVIDFPTNTPTPSDTPTETPVTPTDTPTETPVTPTDTPTETPVTPTDTPTETPVTPTDTPTETPVTPTDTPTETPVTPTDTPTETPVTPTDTPTETPVTPTDTPTETPITPTLTPSNTPITPTNTLTNTPITPTLTFTPSITPSPTNTTCPAVAVAPTLVSPLHRTHTTDTTPQFRWSTVTGARSYRLMVYTEDRSFEYKKRVFVTSYTLTTAEALVPAKYLWRVRTQDELCTTWSKWSNRNTLFVD